MFQIGFQGCANEFPAAQHDPAQTAALAVDMLGRGIDHDVCAKLQRALEHGGCKHVVHNQQRPGLMCDFRNCGDVDHFERRVRDGFEKTQPGVGPHRCAPLVRIGAVDEGNLDSVSRQQGFADVQTRAEQCARCNHMVAGLDAGHQRAIHRRHAAGGGKGVLGAFQRRDALFEHAHGRVAIAGIDVFVIAQRDKAGLGLFGAVIDEPLGQKDRLGHLTVLAAAAAGMYEACSGFPVVGHVVSSCLRRTKKPPTARYRGHSATSLAACFTWPAIR